MTSKRKSESILHCFNKKICNDGEGSFRSISNQDEKLKMDNVDEELRINIRSILCSISEDTVNGIIHALKYAGIETISDLQFAREEYLRFVLKPILRQKLIKAWSKQNLAMQTNPSTSAEGGQTSKEPHSSHEGWQQAQSMVSLNPPNVSLRTYQTVDDRVPSSNFYDLAMQTNPATSAEGGQTSKEPRSSHEGWQQSHQAQSMVPLNPPNVSSRTYQTFGDRVPSSNFYDILSLKKLSPQIFKWKRRRCFALLEIYAKYKAEFSCLPGKDKKMWEMIADEIGKRYHESNYGIDASTCYSKVEELRRKYEDIKSQSKISKAQRVFLNKVKVAFETDENSGILSQEKLNALSSNLFKWKIKRCFALLQIYANYKAEFPCYYGQEWKVWEMIAAEMENRYYLNSCSIHPSSCYYMIEELRRKYQKIKRKRVISQRDYAFLEEAKVAFETSENSGIYPSNVTVMWKWTKDRSLHLLRVFTKYLPELSCPVVQKEEVWKIIAREVGKHCHINCDEVQCRNRIDEMKCEYEAMKNVDIKTATPKTVRFLDGAKIAFETNENSDTPNRQIEVKKEVDKYTPPHMKNEENKQDESSETTNTPNRQIEVKKEVDKYTPPHMKNEENKQDESSETTNRTFTVKVKNLSEDVRESDLEKLFRSVGGTIPHYISIMKDTSNQSKCVAFIRFGKEKDAVRAIITVDGIEYNKQILNVEWAKPFEAN